MKINDAFLRIGENNPVYIMGMFLIILCLIMLVAGILIAVVLKKKSREMS